MDKKFLVIGSSGYLGQCVSRLLDGQVIVTHRTSPKFPNSIAYDFYQDERLPVDLSAAPIDEMTVIFTAAVEMNQPAERLAEGMKRLLIQVSKSRFIYISSDAIFDGEVGNYSEPERPNPVNPYGHNLVMCEKLVTELVADNCIVRPSYIYGFNHGRLDDRLNRTKETLLRGEIYRAYDNYYKCPLSVHEVADAVVHLAYSDYNGPIHVAGRRMSAYEFHRRAMETIDVDTANLLSEPMPDKPGLMPDTSLDSSLWWQMRGRQPMEIEEALQIV